MSNENFADVNGQHQISLRQILACLVRPFNQLEARAGKNISKTRIFPFVWIIETIKIKMPDL